MINFKTSQIILIIFLAIFVVSCRKDDETEAQRKESLAIKLNNEINADSIRDEVTWLQNMTTRFSLADNHRIIALNIKNRFKSYGFTNCRIDSFMINKTYRNVNYQQWQYNVIASIEGSSPEDSVCIIGGHYDNILSTGDPFSRVYGANDNASGVAAVLEVARVMKSTDYSPANTIEFIAFGSEELGLLGSYAYSNSSKQSLKKVMFMLNNDMIAFQKSANKSDWVVNIMDYDNSHNLRLEAEKLCSRFTVLKYYNDNTYNKQSDSYPFFINGYKPLFFFSGTTDPYYHTLNDQAANCNFEYCSEIVRLVCSILVYHN